MYIFVSGNPPVEASKKVIVERIFFPGKEKTKEPESELKEKFVPTAFKESIGKKIDRPNAVTMKKYDKYQEKENNPVDTAVVQEDIEPTVKEHQLSMPTKFGELQVCGSSSEKKGIFKESIGKQIDRQNSVPMKKYDKSQEKENNPVDTAVVQEGIRPMVKEDQLSMPQKFGEIQVYGSSSEEKGIVLKEKGKVTKTKPEIIRVPDCDVGECKQQ